MKKGIVFSLAALVLIGIVVFAIWRMDEGEKTCAEKKDSFIPYNSALVLRINARPRLPEEAEKALEPVWDDFRKSLLLQAADTLRKGEYVKLYPYVLALRVEGKSDFRFLYVMDGQEFSSGREVADFLNRAFAAGQETFRKYDRHQIYSLKHGGETVYFALCGGIILLSDSDLYIEDGLKQFDREEERAGPSPFNRNFSKYFSVGAEAHVFLNTAFFTEVMPCLLKTKEIFPHLDLARMFKWGALDGEAVADGLCLNGFLQYGGMEGSYIRTLAGQQSGESNMKGIIPLHLVSLGMLNLSDPEGYFLALEEYRRRTGERERTDSRKRQFDRMFGKGMEKELQQLLQGEFALVGLGYDERMRERDGLLVVSLKSGSLGQVWIEKMIEGYARFDGRKSGEYVRQYSVDRGKSFACYPLPVEDLPAVYWGPLFGGIKSRFAFVEGNYLIVASSENAVKSFIKDWAHGNFIQDAGWLRELKAKLSGKYTLAYFARTEEVLPQYRDWTVGDVQRYITRHAEGFSLFPALALQWSVEGKMLYNTFFLSVKPIQEKDLPHLLWQTRLDAKVSGKPAVVVNHLTGERELLVQDDRNMVYLLNDGGRILWKMPVDGRINSEVYQVDLFKNGKLQYVFSTPSKCYLIDRNGNAVGRFPLTFPARCEQGITVCDYDGSKDYRIFAPCADREVHLYGLDGNVVEGWKPGKADKTIVSRVRHFRVKGKDYLVFADRYRLYILDRKGKERVRVASVFDLPERTGIYPVRRKSEEGMLFSDRTGGLHWIDFSGHREKLGTGPVGEHFRMNVADIDRDGTEECVFSAGNSLLVMRTDGKVLWKKEIGTDTLGYPYVYRFSSEDVRIGLSDCQGQLFLLAGNGRISEGFPLAGDSPFSLTFSEKDGFCLFSGADNGSLIKYRVPR